MDILPFFPHHESLSPPAILGIFLKYRANFHQKRPSHICFCRCRQRIAKIRQQIVATKPPPKLSPTQSPNTPTIPRPQADHSCEGRNLTVMCDNNAKSARTLPFPHRPFLRRQESQSIKSGNAASNPPPKLPPTQSPKSPTNLPSSLRPFLRRQESHSVVCANNGGFAHNCPFPPQLIPAKAGISKGNALPRQIWRHDTVRFLPTQEWSTGERESIGKYGIVAARRQLSPNCRRIPRIRPIAIAESAKIAIPPIFHIVAADTLPPKNRHFMRFLHRFPWRTIIFFANMVFWRFFML